MDTMNKGQTAAENINALDVYNQVPTIWGGKLTPCACTNCQAVFFVRTAEVPEICPRCLHRSTATAVDTRSKTLQHTPELVIPFGIQESTITRAVDIFAAQIPYPPHDLTAANIAKRMRPHYLSAWLVDTEVEASWQSEMGFNYQVVSHQDRFNQASNRWISQEIQETRIRWEPRLGSLSRKYQNIAAPALEDEKLIQRAVGEFDLAMAKPYESELLPENAYIEMPNRSTEDAWADAVIHLHKLAGEDCRLAGNADHIRNFRWEPRFDRNQWSLLLRPTYTSFYLDDDQQTHRIVIHGTTGALHGSRIASMQRAQTRALNLVILAAAIVFIGLLAGAAGLLFPPVIFVSAILILIGVGVGVGAVVPLVQVWQFNRQQPRN
jgi:hypothetical protein